MLKYKDIKKVPKYNRIFENIYFDRLKRVDRKRAFIDAKVYVTAQVLKEHLNKKDIMFIWKHKEIKENSLPTDDFKNYEVDGNIILLSTNKNLPDNFPNAERTGILKGIKDDFEIELIFKLEDKYEIKLHPEMFYVINPR